MFINNSVLQRITTECYRIFTILYDIESINFNSHSLHILNGIGPLPMTGLSVKTMRIKSFQDKICTIWQMNDVPDKSFIDIPGIERFRDSCCQEGIDAF